MRELNRLEFVGETMLFALNTLTQVDPEWLRSVAPAGQWLLPVSGSCRSVAPAGQWLLPSGTSLCNGRFTSFRLPRSRAKREALADIIGRDGWHLMSCVYGEDAPEYLQQVPAVDTLRRVWIQQSLALEPDDVPVGTFGSVGAGTVSLAEFALGKVVCELERRGHGRSSDW